MKKGRTIPREQREKISRSLRGIRKSPETRRRISESSKGKVLSQKTREKLRAANIGRKHSEETKKKMSRSRMGRVLSEETRRKIGDANRGRKHSLEQRQRMSELRRRRGTNNGVDVGYLYVFPTPCGGIKIGITSHPKNRRAAHRKSGLLPKGGQFGWLSIKVRDPFEIEQATLKDYDGERDSEIIYGWELSSIVANISRRLEAR